MGQHGMPRTQRARPGPSHTSLRTSLGAATYAIKAARAAAPEAEGEAAVRLECQWQRGLLSEAIRELVAAKHEPPLVRMGNAKSPARTQDLGAGVLHWRQGSRLVVVSSLFVDHHASCRFDLEERHSVCLNQPV